ncbi:magnesium transporter CorA family protein [Entomobacter blattae]|uniref:Uncharacterized protein n=1 Tax=Entomobacter blattae TaxID=2762277 RepID=A0A7H1NPN9_9PROT|nr:hypothetical protein [Entomobacter blattae]QNT77749.1 hypothetical protein JGUZn3_05010 [Entomobacter blattae]
MLLAHNWGQSSQEYSDQEHAAKLHENIPWLDLLNPTEEEENIAEKITGFRIPTRVDMEEIESSSRLYMEDDRVYMTTPMIRFLGESFVVSPVGFVLNGLQLNDPLFKFYLF